MKIIKLILLSSIVLVSCKECKKEVTKKEKVKIAQPHSPNPKKLAIPELDNSRDTVAKTSSVVKKEHTPKHEPDKAQRFPTEEWKKWNNARNLKWTLYRDSVRRANRKLDSLKL